MNMKIKMCCGIGFNGANHYDTVEIDDSEFDGMTEEQKDEYIYEEYVLPFAYEYLEAWYEEID